ncbi:hypothetical protein ACFSHR_16790 [Azotobacter chroococcum]
MHHEHRIHRQEHAEQQAVEEGFVVGDDQRARIAEDVAVALDLDPKEDLEEQAQKGLEHDRSLAWRSRQHGDSWMKAKPCWKKSCRIARQVAENDTFVR